MSPPQPPSPVLEEPEEGLSPTLLMENGNLNASEVGFNLLIFFSLILLLYSQQINMQPPEFSYDSLLVLICRPRKDLLIVMTDL